MKSIPISWTLGIFELPFPKNHLPALSGRKNLARVSLVQHYIKNDVKEETRITKLVSAMY